MSDINIEVTTIRTGFERIKNAVGKEKENVIRDLEKHSPLAFKALVLYLNPAVVFHLGEKSFDKDLALDMGWFKDLCFGELCGWLTTQNGLNNGDIGGVRQWISELIDEADRAFARSFLCKTYKLGATEKTVNKAVGYEAIPILQCMLANKYFEHAEYVTGKNFFVTEKLDGIRCLAVVRPDEPPKLFSRQGQPICGLVDIEYDLKKIYKRVNKGFVLDGELLITDRDKYPSKTQYKETTKIVRTDNPNKHGITFNAFDVLDLDAFDDKKCEMQYYLRRQKLNAYCDGLEFIKAVPVIYSGKNESMILTLLEDQRSRGHEGVMVNIADSFYQFKRTNELLKVKVMQDCDLVITDVLEGSGKFEGVCGALVCDYKGNPVGVGSGMTDTERAYFLKHKDELIGRVATVQYFEETVNKDGVPSIRFPVFKCIREEGKEISYN